MDAAFPFPNILFLKFPSSVFNLANDLSILLNLGIELIEQFSRLSSGQTGFS